MRFYPLYVEYKHYSTISITQVWISDFSSSQFRNHTSPTYNNNNNNNNHHHHHHQSVIFSQKDSWNKQHIDVTHLVWNTTSTPHVAPKEAPAHKTEPERSKKPLFTPDIFFLFWDTHEKSYKTLSDCIFIYSQFQDKKKFERPSRVGQIQLCLLTLVNQGIIKLEIKLCTRGEKKEVQWKKEDFIASYLVRKLTNIKGNHKLNSPAESEVETAFSLIKTKLCCS